MAYNEQLGNKIREALQHLPNVTEKVMFGGLCFMVDEKMCIGVVKDELMCRFDPNSWNKFHHYRVPECSTKMASA